MRARLRIHRPSFGAALAEGLVVIFISSMFLSVLPGFYLTYVKVWQREAAELGVVHSADFALRRMHDDVRNARNALLSSDGTTLTLTLPKKVYDSEFGRPINAVDAAGSLIDGDTVQYYFLQDPDGKGSAGGSLYRRVIHSDGTQEAPHLIAERLYPNLNPQDTGATDSVPLFAADSTLRTVTVVVTAAEPKPSSGTFAAPHQDPKCRRCHGDLIRVPTSDSLEGVIQCSQCDGDAESTAEIVTYRTQLLLRNQ